MWQSRNAINHPQVITILLSVGCLHFFVNHPKKKWWFYDIGLPQKTDDETQAIFCGTIEKSNPRHSIGECVGGTIGES